MSIDFEREFKSNRRVPNRCAAALSEIHRMHSHEAFCKLVRYRSVGAVDGEIDSFLTLIIMKDTIPLRRCACIVNGCKIGTLLEYIATNVGAAIRNCDTCKIFATVECLRSDFYHTARDYKVAGQTGTIRKCSTPNYCYPIRDYTIFTSLNQVTLCCFDQAVAIGMIYGVFFVNSNALKARTIGECAILNARYTARNCNACKAFAIVERGIADFRHAVGNCNARKACATAERISADACHTIGNRDACKALTAMECLSFYTRYAVADHNIRKTCASGKRRIADFRHAVGYLNLCDKHVVQI